MNTERMRQAHKAAIEELRKLSVDEIDSMAEKYKSDDPCVHSFVRDFVEQTFSCCRCGCQTDGKSLKEWRI